MMLLRIAPELAATGAVEIFWFQGLSAGKSELPSRVGTVRSSRASSASRARANLRVKENMVICLRESGEVGARAPSAVVPGGIDESRLRTAGSLAAGGRGHESGRGGRGFLPNE